jgi:hypothetical protein
MLNLNHNHTQSYYEILQKVKEFQFCLIFFLKFEVIFQHQYDIIDSIILKFLNQNIQVNFLMFPFDIINQSFPLRNAGGHPINQKLEHPINLTPLISDRVEISANNP